MITPAETTARPVELSAQELEQISRWRDTARKLLDDATLGMRDRFPRATYTTVANAWMSLAQLVLEHGTPAGGDIAAAERCLLLASNPNATAEVRGRAFDDSAAYRRAARLSVGLTAAQVA